jgi:hypothetical protein
MKTKQTTIHRSAAKWLPGAMALAATAASSQAAVVQITLTGNKLTSLGVNTLNADVTGDGAPDITLSNVYFGVDANGSAGAGFGFANGIRFRADYFTSGYFQVMRNKPPGFGLPVGLALGTSGSGWAFGTALQSAVFLTKIAFSDPNIRGGALTDAWLEVGAFNESKVSHTVQLTRVIFDDASGALPVFATANDVPGWASIPEPSSFALLGLGAAGLLARRRRQAA